MPSTRRPVLAPGDILSGGSNIDPTGSFDIMIDDIPFLAAYTAQTPLEIASAPVRKEQQDSSLEPGEHSISSDLWWYRSQSSFHLGAGRLFLEPADQNDAQFNRQEFHSLQGLDVWSPGKVTLLHNVVGVQGTTGPVKCLAVSDVAVLSWADKQLVYNLTVSPYTPTPVSWGAAGVDDIIDVTTDGANYYVATATAIYKGALNTGAGSILYNITATNVKLAWVKQRLMAAIDGSVYQLDANAIGPVALPTANFVHPTADWLWTAFTEGPQAIYAAGYAGISSAVFKFVLDNTNDVPTLSSGITVLQLPEGEIAYSLYVYIQGFALLGTNRGVRVCFLSPYSGTDYTLGALSVNFEQAGIPAGPVLCITGYDRFAYCGFSRGHVDGNSGLVRIDLSQVTGTNKFAWAPDLATLDQFTFTGDVTSVTMCGNRPVFTTTTDDEANDPTVWALDPTRYLTSGTLNTANIRFGTLEPKLFRVLTTRFAKLPTGTSIQASITDSNGTTSPLPIIVGTGQPSAPEQNISLSAQEFVSLSFQLNGDDDHVLTPEFRGYQLKVLVAPKRLQIISLPVSVFDHDLDQTGDGLGYDGFGLERLMRLRALEQTGDQVTVQHLTDDPESRMVYTAVIDSVHFVQTTNPMRHDGFGGIATIVLRTTS